MQVDNRKISENNKLITCKNTNQLISREHLKKTNNSMFTKGKDVKCACKCLVIQLMKRYSVRTNKNL